jgi:SRSO17 transposase
MRWTIETYFRDAKQHLGLSDYQVRGLKGIKSHWGKGLYISYSA